MSVTGRQSLQICIAEPHGAIMKKIVFAALMLACPAEGQSPTANAVTPTTGQEYGVDTSGVTYTQNAGGGYSNNGTDATDDDWDTTEDLLIPGAFRVYNANGNNPAPAGFIYVYVFEKMDPSETGCYWYKSIK